MESNTQENFKLDGIITGKIRKGTEFPQSPGYANLTGALDTDISFEGVVLKNTEKVVFRITKVNDRRRGNFAKEYQPQEENESFGLAVLLLDQDQLLTRVGYGNEF
jgi:hypothetical protein